MKMELCQNMEGQQTDPYGKEILDCHLGFEGFDNMGENGKGGLRQESQSFSVTTMIKKNFGIWRCNSVKLNS